MHTGTYYAITTTGGDWRILVAGQGTRESIRQAAHTLLLCGADSLRAGDIVQETEMKNLCVISLTEARRLFGRTLFDRMYEAVLPEAVDDVLASAGADWRAYVTQMQQEA